jgi:hypothetical protein
MKKQLVTGALTVLTSLPILAQGLITLDAYNSSLNPTVMWWSPEGYYPNYTGGHPLPLNTYANFTIGFYWAPGVVNYTDPNATIIGGYGVPGSPFTLATGTGATTSAFVGDTFFTTFGSDFVVPGVSSGTVTVIVIAYSGSDYVSSAYRGHSLPFQINVSPSFPQLVGDYMPSFYVSHLEGYSAVPEPSTFAVAFLGFSLLTFKLRRN